MVEVEVKNYGLKASLGKEIFENRINRNIQGTEVKRELEKIETKNINTNK